jgi:5,10-methylenetetrahydromethanopterin reductase
VRLGYRGLWTTGGTYDPFQLCSDWGASGGAASDGPQVGIAIVPVTAWPSPVALATTAATTAELTGGRFILGLGVGHPTERAPTNIPEIRPVPLAREHLTVLRRLLAGERVDHDGTYVQLRHTEIGWRPPHVPLYIAALGPAMLRLAGTAADGVLLNWCSREQVAWSRSQVDEGIRSAGRQPGDVRIVTQVRVAIDDDVERARRAIARSFVMMTLRTPREAADRGYRAQATRLGLGDLVEELAVRQDAGASLDSLASAIPADAIDTLAYAGPASGAAAAVARLAEGCDVAIIRCVSTGPARDAVAVTLDACRPTLVATAR